MPSEIETHVREMTDLQLLEVLEGDPFRLTRTALQVAHDEAARRSLGPQVNQARLANFLEQINDAEVEAMAHALPPNTIEAVTAAYRTDQERRAAARETEENAPQLEGELVTVGTFTTTARADVIRTDLEAAGIACFLPDETIARTLPYLMTARLQVSAKDVEAARALIAEFQKATPPEPPTLQLPPPLPPRSV